MLPATAAIAAAVPVIVVTDAALTAIEVWLSSSVRAVAATEPVSVTLRVSALVDMFSSVNRLVTLSSIVAVTMPVVSVVMAIKLARPALSNASSTEAA